MKSSFGVTPIRLGLYGALVCCFLRLWYALCLSRWHWNDLSAFLSSCFFRSFSFVSRLRGCIIPTIYRAMIRWMVGGTTMVRQIHLFITLPLLRNMNCRSYCRWTVGLGAAYYGLVGLRVSIRSRILRDTSRTQGNDNSLVTMLKRLEFPVITTFLGEIVVLSVLWLFWIVGAADSSVRISFLTLFSSILVLTKQFKIIVDLGRPFILSRISTMSSFKCDACICVVRLDNVDGVVGFVGSVLYCE